MSVGGIGLYKSPEFLHSWRVYFKHLGESSEGGVCALFFSFFILFFIAFDILIFCTVLHYSFFFVVLHSFMLDISYF